MRVVETSLAKAVLSSPYRARPFEQTRGRDEFWKRGRATRTLLAHLSSLLMIVRPRDAAQFRRATSHRSAHRLFLGIGSVFRWDVESSDRFNRHRNRPNFATYWLDRFPVFLPRLLRPLYNLSAFHTTALTCLKSPMRKLHSFAAPTYDNLSVYVMEAARRSFHLSLSRGEAISFAS